MMMVWPKIFSSGEVVKYEKTLEYSLMTERGKGIC